MDRVGEYPAHRVADVGLRDGSTIRVRPVLPDDLEAVTQLFADLSEASTWKRFHGMHRPDREELRPFVELDNRTRFTIVAVA
ncbi:MAG: hypothetical protein QOH90_2204, partial [Actinomycetota bacterium]|nr:hypothetical protein [Actinomycetota bacterium]